MQWQRIALSISTFRFPVLTRLGGIHKTTICIHLVIDLIIFKPFLEKLFFSRFTAQNQTAFPILFFHGAIISDSFCNGGIMLIYPSVALAAIDAEGNSATIQGL